MTEYKDKDKEKEKQEKQEKDNTAQQDQSQQPINNKPAISDIGKGMLGFLASMKDSINSPSPLITPNNKNDTISIDELKMSLPPPPSAMPSLLPSSSPQIHQSSLSQSQSQSPSIQSPSNSLQSSLPSNSPQPITQSLSVTNAPFGVSITTTYPHNLQNNKEFEIDQIINDLILKV
ncbi:MAG: hypothetical protein EZS28_050519 [Streblomastix strix]|uniref:Uncharacterized protein n=1 Tax=Streblomastix strix TaxID=222440 RepID=A0A5J4T6G1_9EUKA|nr:MAG: hypothetical protein EZS28_050519 [Streblomastix strix]